jgi:Zn-dependent metalloprotease
VVVHEKDDKVLSVNGEFVKINNLSLGSAIDTQSLNSIISASISDLSGKIEIANPENVVAKLETKDGIKLYSATKVSAYSFSPLTSKVYYVDNNTKQIVNSYSLIHNADTPSVSTTNYKGNQNIIVDSYTGGYRLKNNAKKVWTVDGTGITTSDITSIASTTDGFNFFANGATSTTYNTDYNNSTANFTSAATKTAVEVQWSISASNDYYLARLNRNSYDGAGTPIVNYNNFNFGTAASPNGQNATAISLPASNGITYRFMAFGNGGLPLFNPFVGIDVGGHEYSHLVVGTNGTGGLAYQAESGAINEAFADILGASIEFFATPTQANWTIGEGLVNPGTYTGGGQTYVLTKNYLRNMATPKVGDALTGGQQPDTYNGQYWASTLPPYNQNNDQGGVHTNSGIGNKWYYLLSMGGSGTNDNGTAYNVQGLTIQVAEKIAYKTLTGGYLTANSNYLALYTASKQAAIALYGNGNQVQQVENAWCAVGVGNCLVLATSEVTKADLDGVKIYPNPVSNGQFTITSNLKKEGTYEIVDASGKVISQGEKLQKGDNKVNISGVTSGVYILKVTADGQSVTKKIIVK